jgi:hypothetical protein
MFVGHYSVSFALKTARPQVPLWVLFLAVQAVDIGWGILILLGIEKARIVPGITKAFPLDLYYMPYTHSLVAGIGWAMTLAALYFAWRRRHGVGAALAIGVAVLSHWFLDLPVHTYDLPLYDNTDKQGWGLWDYPLLEWALEAALLLGAAALYLRSRPQQRKAAWIFCGALVLIQAGQNLGPWLLPNAAAVAVSALLSYAAFAWIASRIERRGA